MQNTIVDKCNNLYYVSIMEKEKTDNIHNFRRLLRYLERYVMVNLKDDSMCCGVTSNQCHILLETSERGEVDISELRDYLGLDKSTISRIVDSLVNTDLILRKENPEDRRYQKVSLSDKGKILVESIDAECDLHYSVIFNALPDTVKGRINEDMQALSDVFIKVLGSSRKRSCCDITSLDGSLEIKGDRNG
jgi:DNA-binding MarR family transcriptional regulator